MSGACGTRTEGLTFMSVLAGEEKKCGAENDSGWKISKVGEGHTYTDSRSQ